MNEDGSNSHFKVWPPIRIACGPLTLRGYNLKNTEHFFILKRPAERAQKNTTKLYKHEKNSKYFVDPPYGLILLTLWSHSAYFLVKNQTERKAARRRRKFWTKQCKISIKLLNSRIFKDFYQKTLNSRIFKDFFQQILNSRTFKDFQGFKDLWQPCHRLWNAVVVWPT